MMTNPQLRRIFISYSRDDEAFARKLVAALREAGVNTWIDVENISVGTNWSSAVQEGLTKCDLMLVILSPDSSKSKNVEEEWQYYRDKGKPFLPILYRDTEVHYQLTRVQYIDFLHQDFDMAFRQLSVTLSNLGIQLTTAPDGAALSIPEQAPLRPRTVSEEGVVVQSLSSGITAHALRNIAPEGVTALSKMSYFERYYLMVNVALVAVLTLGVGLYATGRTSPLITVILTEMTVFLALSAAAVVTINVIGALLNLQTKSLLRTMTYLITDRVILAKVVTHPLINLIQMPILPPDDELDDAESERIVDFNKVQRSVQVDATTFANVLIEALLPPNIAPRELQQAHGQDLVTMLTSRVNNPEFARTLESMLAQVETLSEVQTIFAGWYQSQLRRMEVSRGRQRQSMMLTVGLVLALILNIDTLHMGIIIFRDAAREQRAAELQAISNALQTVVTTSAANAPADSTGDESVQTLVTDDSLARIQQLLDELNADQFPIGWNYKARPDECSDTGELNLNPPIVCRDLSNVWLLWPSNYAGWLGLWVRKIIGMLLTGMAILFLADLWYRATESLRLNDA